MSGRSDSGTNPPTSASMDAFSGAVYSQFSPKPDGGSRPLLTSGISSASLYPPRPAVLLDRDGVLNIDRGYVHQPDQFEWMEDAPQAVRWLNDRGFLVIVVTNQSGIARGYFTETHFFRFTHWIEARLRTFDARIDATYYCPHHPDAAILPYRLSCGCRKPAPGMVLRAMKEWALDVDRTILIGDHERDLRAARACGIQGFAYSGGSLLKFLQRAVIPLQTSL